MVWQRKTSTKERNSGINEKIVTKTMMSTLIMMMMMIIIIIIITTVLRRLAVALLKIVTITSMKNKISGFIVLS
jgi:hypothetical protein